MEKNNKINRRELLKNMGFATTALPNLSMKNLLGALVGGIVAKAHGATTSANPCNFVMFQIGGGPSRWTWAPLCPYDDPSSIIPNRNVITKLIANSSSEYDSGQYSTVKINNINMPWVWQFDLPTPNGGSRPMSDLMDYMMLFQGVDVVNPAHNGARANQFRPSGISNSITSLTGDVSDAPIPFIGMATSPNPYSSSKQKSGVNNLSRSGNLLKNLLSPFTINSSTAFDSDLNSIDSQMKTFFGKIDDLLTNTDSSYAGTITSDKNALIMIKRSLGDLNTEFYSRRDKYRELLKRATSPFPDSSDHVTLVSGINDNPVMIDGVDIRATLKTKLSSYYMSSMAEEFSVIEYCLVNGITTSLAAGARSFSGFNFDEHSVHHLSACYTNSLWNRGFAACLLELISVLQRAGIWQKTLIQLGGEFGRNPKGTAEGSDHAPGATDITFLGGHLKGNEFVGKTLASSGISRYPGSWGYGAINDRYGKIGLGHMAATLADLLNVESPVTSAASLVTKKNGKYTALLNKTKLV